ncbi:MAG TPA: hypothetical protein VHM26_18160 [Chitinophagaceae bacterium]|jgi:hypothetical protein|nr:hypothetical protein [Chitinophagaceae bacterium]
MAFFIWGHRAANIGTESVIMYECPYCNETNTTLLSIYVRYNHIFWIPLFPYAKEGSAYCTHCERHRNESQFGPQLTHEFREYKKKTRYPWWSWTWVIIFISFIISIFIIAPKS